MSGFEVVVCGGGVAGIEGLLRLHRLAADHIDLTLLCSEGTFNYRPLAVLEPFSRPGTRRYPLERIAVDTGATWVRERLAEVDIDTRSIRTEEGTELSYDALLLAVGGREIAPFEHAHVFSGRNVDQGLRGIVEDVETGKVQSVAFVLAQGPSWPLPLYELALMTAHRANLMEIELHLDFVTAESRPLKAFGQAGGDTILRLLAAEGIRLHAHALAQVPEPGVVTFGDTRLEADRIVTLPAITGPAITGIPAGTGWFVPIDERCVVEGTDRRVFAAGDATDFGIKHGGIGAQQADTAAAGIAHLAGAGERPPPLDPVIRSMMFTGDRPLYIAARVVGGMGWRSEVYERPPSSPIQKLVAEEIGAYLDRRDAPGGRP